MAALVPLPNHDEEFQRLLTFIKSGLSAIRLKWRIYRALFATNKERVELLNTVSGTTALVIQDALYHEVILHLCRLADPPETGKNTNNTVSRLCRLVAPSEASDHLNALVNRLKIECEPLRNQRNWFIAHADRDAIFDKQSFGGVSRLQIEASIDQLSALVTYVAMAAQDTQFLSAPLNSTAMDEVNLLRTLYYGRIKIDEIQKEAISLSSAPADPRSLPPEAELFDELRTRPAWLNYRPSET